MDVSGITRFYTALAQERTSVAMDMAVLKQAIDIQAASAEILLEALPPPQPINPNIGSNINTTA